MRLTEHRDTPRGLPDLLLADTLIKPGILLQNDGSLLTVFRYRGKDLDSSTPSAMNMLVHRISDALMLGSGWMIQCDVIRSEAEGYSDPGHFPDLVSRLIDEERQAQAAAGTRFQSEYFVTLTYLPPLAKNEKLEDWFTGEDRGDEECGFLGHHLATFEDRISRFEDVVARELGAVRLTEHRWVDEYGNEQVDDELLRYLHRCISGDDQIIQQPEVPSMLHDLLGAGGLTADFEPVFGGRKHIRVVAIDGFPKKSHPAILHALDQLSLSYRWTMRAILLDAYEAKKLLDSDRKGWRGGQRGFIGTFLNSTQINQHAVKMEAEVENAQEVAESALVEFCLFNSSIVLMDEDEDGVKRSVRKVVAAIQKARFVAREEYANTVEAWLGSIPGDGYANVRRVKIHTLNLADMMATTAVWEGLRYCPSDFLPEQSSPLMYSETAGSTPFRFHLHVEDVAIALLLGPTGNGKSTLEAAIAAQWFRYEGARVFAFDYKHSLWMINQAMGGTYYDLLGDKGLSFAPLRDLDTDVDMEWASSWVETLCQLSGMEMKPKHRNAITATMKQLRSGPVKYRTLTSFVTKQQDEDIKEAMLHYTLEGGGGLLLDADTDSFAFSRFTCFETRELLATRNPRAIVPVLLYLFRRMNKAILSGEPTLIILEEAWAYLAQDAFATKIDEWLRTVRSYNTGVLIASQQISDFANSRIADTVFSNAKTKILLPNYEADTAAVVGFYERIGLNERQIQLIKGATAKRDYYISQPGAAGGNRMIDFVFGKVALAFCSVNSPEDRREVAELMRSNPRHWRSEWLRRYGAPEWAEYLRGLEQEENICAAVA